MSLFDNINDITSVDMFANRLLRSIHVIAKNC